MRNLFLQGLKKLIPALVYKCSGNMFYCYSYMPNQKFAARKAPSLLGASPQASGVGFADYGTGEVFCEAE